MEEKKPVHKEVPVETNEKNQKYMEFLQKHAARMKHWSDSWGTKKRPPVWEDETGSVHWANREQRRKAAKQLMKKSRKG